VTLAHRATPVFAAPIADISPAATVWTRRRFVLHQLQHVPSLVRSGGSGTFAVGETDVGAGVREEDAQYTPMIPTLVRDPFHRDGWIYGEKVDGWRMLAYKDGARVTRSARPHHALVQAPSRQRGTVGLPLP
jgi:hypothetical protein